MNTYRIGKIIVGCVLVIIIALAVWNIYRRLVPCPSASELVEKVKENGSYRVIEHYLRHKNYKVRVTAVHALCNLGTDQAVKLLEKACDDPSPIVKIAILSDLDKLKIRDRLILIDKLLGNSQESLIQKIAILQLQKITKVNYGYLRSLPYEEGQRIVAMCRKEIRKMLQTLVEDSDKKARGNKNDKDGRLRNGQMPVTQSD